MSSSLPDAPEPHQPAPRPAQPPAVRVGDAERQAVVSRLKAALDEGRLDLHEFDERAALAYAAKTEVDLVPLTEDLPAQPGNAPRPPVVGGGAPVPAPTKRRFSEAEVTWLRLAIILSGIWAITSAARGEFTFYWPVFPIGIWGVFLLANRLTGGGR